jgi:hypothetical protein
MSHRVGAPLGGDVSKANAVSERLDVLEICESEKERAV